VRKEQIITAALELVDNNGMKDLTIAAIAEKIGVVPSGIYQHFKSKAEVVRSIIIRIGERLSKNIEEVCEDTCNAPERLRILHIMHIRMIRKNKGLPSLIFSHDVGESSDRKNQLYDVLQKYLGQLASIARQGQKDGTICIDVAPEAIALMFLGLIQPPAILCHLTDGNFDLNAESARCWHLFYRSITQEKQ
jgi:TetR/AcrR family transcriptional regulator, fatty acid metabolism regulator protein